MEMTGIMPDVVCACVGGGSNSAGMSSFLADPVEIVGVEPRSARIDDNAR